MYDKFKKKYWRQERSVFSSMLI